MHWAKRSDDVGLGYQWVCSKGCTKRVSPRKYTWFEDSRISVEKLLLLIYLFASGTRGFKAVEESALNDEETSPETISDFYSYCREVCAETMIKKTVNKISGAGMIVEIDEGKFGKRKYNRGRLVDGVWVLGGICRETKEMFLLPVEKRDAGTLIPIIVNKVAAGTTIMTDCWKAYDSLPQHGFQHQTVNHSQHFVDPETQAHTQSIENTWWQIKRKLPETHTHKGDIGEYLSEFLWRSSVRKEGIHPFDALIRDIAEMYTGKNI